MRQLLIPLVLAALLGGKSPASGDVPADFTPTHIPLDLNVLTEEQRALIHQGHETDPTPYLMQSRPVVFQIVEATHNADEHRSTGPITERAEVLIYAQGEAAGDRLVDHGWVESLETGEVVWRMTPENSEHGGGDPRNRRAVETLWLEPGTYQLRYVSNETHAFGDWQGEPPEHPLHYGIVVFNLAAISSIKERFREAGIGVD